MAVGSALTKSVVIPPQPPQRYHLMVCGKFLAPAASREHQLFAQICMPGTDLVVVDRTLAVTHISMEEDFGITVWVFS